MSQPLQWGSEYNDTELSLVYYNYRYYNPIDAKWITRDLEKNKAHDKYSLYRYLYNASISNIDFLGAAKLVKRPLLLIRKQCPTGEKIYTIRMMDIVSIFGWKTYHSHFVFDDGSDIGYFEDGKLKPDPDHLIHAVDVRVGLDDNILKKAIDLTPPKSYSASRIIIETISYGEFCVWVARIDNETDNCNTWADRVLKKYDELMNEKNV